MATFTLGDCSLTLAIVPLDGELAAADRRIAWRLMVELLARPALRGESADADDLAGFVAELRRLIQEWPAAEVAQHDPGHLGPFTLAAIEWILLPCLAGADARAGAGADAALPDRSWRAVRDFLQSWAGELALRYRFGDASRPLPADLCTAWLAPPQ